MLERFAVVSIASFGLTVLFSLLLLKISSHTSVAIKPELMATQARKKGTPVVGGIAFCLGTLASSFLDKNFSRPIIWLPLLALVLFGLIGFIDDRMKTHTSNGDGLSSRLKLILQAGSAVILLLVMNRLSLLETTLRILRWKVELSLVYYLFAALYILYFVNAVNITDGLDALAAGSSLPLLLLILLLSERSSSFASPALFAALLAFLLFNKRPAKYFMGDCGSHAIGAFLAVSALLLKKELVLFFASGLFLVELGTSLIQIISIRRFGRKVFLIAPLHHAYEMKGVGEGRIVAAFTFASWVFATVSLLLNR